MSLAGILFLSEDNDSSSSHEKSELDVERQVENRDWKAVLLLFMRFPMSQMGYVECRMPLGTNGQQI